MAENTKNLVDLTEADVVSAYRGKAGKCACGCSGTHRYMDAESGTAHRGYQVDEDEVNPVFVATILRKIQRNAAEAESFGTGWSLVVGSRLLCVYTK